MRLLVTLLFAVSLAADQTVSLHPVAPTSLTPIELHILVNCQVTDESVERVGSLIKVNLTVLGICDPPVTFSHVVPIEPLPPGAYRVEVTMAGVEGSASTSFIVRDGSRQLYAVHPFAVRTVVSGMRMWIDSTTGESLCAGGTCDGVRIRVGGSEVARLDAVNGAAMFDAPALALGLYDVTVQKGDVVTTLPRAVYYFEEPDISVFERILFPVLREVSGANGSRWTVEGVIANPKPWWVENFNSAQPFVCLQYPCGERLSPRLLSKFSGGNYLHGLALLAPRPEAPFLSFSLRVRDIAYASLGFGTEVPVVREKNMLRNTEIALLDVPLDARYRVKLRMYAFEPFYFPQEPRGRVVIGDKEQFVTYRRDCSACPQEPAYAELDLPPGGEGAFATIYIEPPPESFAWAFASVTNNVTQQVTIVTPNGEGGEP